MVAVGASVALPLDSVNLLDMRTVRPSGPLLSPLDSLNVRRLLMEIQKAVERAMTHNVSDFNDPITRKRLTNQVHDSVEYLTSKVPVRDFKVICDETNNMPELIDRGEISVDVWVAPIQIVEHVNFKFVMSPTGISLS